MSLFPRIEPANYEFIPVWKTLSSVSDSTKEQRKQKMQHAVYDVTLTYDYLSEADMQTLWSFYMQRKGSYEAFYFYDFKSYVHTTLWVGMGDGIEYIFDIPGESTSSHEVYINGGVLSSGYTILTGGGNEDSDRIQFTSPPSEGQIITISFTGYLRAYCRFKEDKLSRQSFFSRAYQTGINLKGLTPL